MTVAITRPEHTAAALRRCAAGSADASVVRRLLALALVLDGPKREDAARSAGMDRQTLRDGVRRHNAAGLSGLGGRHGGGAPSRLPPEREAAVADWIRTRPGVEKDGVVRWRCVDIQARVAREWGVPCTAALASFCTVSASPACPRARAIPRRTSWRKRLPGRVHRPYDRSAARSCAGDQGPHRGLAPRRGPRRPAGHPDLRVGRQG